MSKSITTLLVLGRRHRRATATLVYAGITGAGLALAYLTRFEFELDVLATQEFASLLAVLTIIRLVVNYCFRLGISRWRFVGTQDFVRLLAAVTTGSVLFMSLSWLLPFVPNVPRSVVLLEWLLNGYLTGGTWVAYRLVYEYGRVREAGSQRRVLIVGAGEAGQQIVHQMLRSRRGYTPVGIVDDDPFKWGTLIHGVEVIGALDDMARIVEHCRPDQILIAVPSATSQELRRIVELSEVADLPLRILPGVEDVISGDANLAHVRPVRLEDLLGRDPVKLELPELAESLGGRTVLVTGAAGSIGSELARQIAIHRPHTLVLYDQAETPLYYLELELRRLAPAVNLVPLVASVTDTDAVKGVFDRYRPHRVYHAAAYKHVPLMEHNRRSVVQTNVLGTYIVASHAGKAGSNAFVLVSTDKSVRPSNMMGASKQLAERCILHLQRRYPDTAFGAVRFGNVLGSNGSVIPLFRSQLERGEPLTVTHEDVTRYFMTIPEAVQLILKASLLEEFRGHVAMLDMGEPVRIVELARNLLRLSGRPFRPGENVIITGLRAGEKMHEELSAPDEAVTETEVPRVRLVETPPRFSRLDYDLVSALEERDVEGLLHLTIRDFPDVAGKRKGPRAVGPRVRIEASRVEAGR